ncbi:gliding motility-associated C-terminal domain-containing protein [uncultured Aquimarina sp.]|uniref:Ig-like domain-containing protein n=1 Tax=uncultured Aquimarina sp. TaxID=575652 RepID=UPI002612DB1F|nr:gliding motility-associated C-terminal domain-containing protein [uncultured Aquimarina sp.]
MRRKLNLVFVLIVLALGFQEAFAQVRNIGAPTLVSGAQACGTLTNSFDFTADLSAGAALDSNNQFILQLSNPSGSFANASEITDLASADGPNEASGAGAVIEFFDVTVPQDANSDDYRLRVIATDTNATILNEISDPIPFHFFDDDNLLIRLNSGDDIIFCNVASFAKEVAVVVLDQNNNEVDVNSFNWEWLRDGALIPGENSPRLLITEEGDYQARVSVGLCNNVFVFNKSNRISASLVNQGEISIVTTAPDFSFCPDETKILRASVEDPSYGYQWSKDGEELEGEVLSFLVLPDNDFGGEYVLQIELSEDCTLPTPPVTVTNEGSSITTPLPPGLVLLPTQILTLTVETDAPIGSTFRWIRDTNIIIQGVTTGSTITFDVPANGVGDYRLEIDALFPDDPCMSELVTETVVVAAERFDITIAPGEVVDCDQDTITIALEEMVGITSTNDRVPLTTEQFDFFDFEWFNDGVSTGETSLSLDVSRADNGGSFELRAIFNPGGLPDTVSNNLPIDFLSNSIVLDINPAVLEDGQTVTLTAPASTNFTYEWYVIQNGTEVLIDGETTNTLTVSEEGDYFARISSSLCTTDTLIAEVRGPGALSELIPNVVTPGGNAANNSWVLPNSFTDNDVEVSIYSSNGKLDFQKNGGYNADWPNESASQASELIYYYIISRSNTVVKKGTITVMR